MSTAQNAHLQVVARRLGAALRSDAEGISNAVRNKPFSSVGDAVDRLLPFHLNQPPKIPGKNTTNKERSAGILKMEKEFEEQMLSFGVLVENELKCELLAREKLNDMLQR